MAHLIISAAAYIECLYFFYKSCEERMGGKRVGSKSVVRGNEETLSEFSQRVMGCIDTP